MNEIEFNNIPESIKINILSIELDIILEIIKKAKLLKEFKEFVQSDEMIPLKTLYEITSEFSKKHPTVAIQNQYGYSKFFRMD